MTKTIHHEVRRHADGSIDFDFYRKGATALRRQAMREAGMLKAVRAGLVAMAATLGVVVLIAASSTPAPRGVAATVQTAAPQIW
jgi:hypothetical protein